MTKKKMAKSEEDFDRRFDDGEDIHDPIDISKVRIIRHGKKVLITRVYRRTDQRNRSDHR